ncbi:MAG: MBOAT family protein, partial [Eubacteriales bacterium]
MLFNSLDFIGFIIIVIPLYFIIPHKFRWVLLLAASYIFYMSWNVGYIALILFTTTVNYIMGRLMGTAKTKRARKAFLLIGLIASLAVLFGFKYLNFMISIVNGAFTLVHSDFALTPLNILLPVGISFFTLQTLSYTIDVYMGKTPVEKHFGIFALYVSFFPQLVAGPIERSEHLLPQFYEKHSFDPDRFRTGVYKMLGGFFMKMVVADRLAMMVNTVYGAPEEFYGLAVGIATFGFALQIYCDFAGYSLIAIGVAEILGFRLMQNFKSPYLATNIQAFWSR